MFVSCREIKVLIGKGDRSGVDNTIITGKFVFFSRDIFAVRLPMEPLCTAATTGFKHITSFSP